MTFFFFGVLSGLSWRNSFFGDFAFSLSLLNCFLLDSLLLLDRLDKLLLLERDLAFVLFLEFLLLLDVH